MESFVFIIIIIGVFRSGAEEEAWKARLVGDYKHYH